MPPAGRTWPNARHRDGSPTRTRPEPIGTGGGRIGGSSSASLCAPQSSATAGCGRGVSAASRGALGLDTRRASRIDLGRRTGIGETARIVLEMRAHEPVVLLEFTGLLDQHVLRDRIETVRLFDGRTMGFD